MEQGTETKAMKMDACNLILHVDTEQYGEATAYVPQPNLIELKSISRVLAHFYTSYNNGDKPEILIVDYERFIDEALEPINNTAQKELKLKQVDIFLERSLLGAKWFDSEYSELDSNKLSDEDKALFNGTLLFISALFHYLGKKGRQQFIKDFFTSLDVMAWKEHCKKQLEQSTKAHKDTNTKKKTHKETQENTQEETSLFISVGQS